MRPLLPLALSLLVACTLQARATENDGGELHHRHHAELSSRQCGLTTAFNVLVDTGGVWLYRDHGVPREIFFHDGRLSIDQQVQQVGADDAQRLRELEQQARLLMPQVTTIAHAAVELSYDALGGVVEVLTGSGGNARKIARLRGRAHTYVDDTLGKGRWDQHAFDGNFERYVEQQAEQFQASIARHMLWQIMTGRTEGIDARAKQLEGQLDAKLDAQAAALEAQANALCAQVDQVQRLQSALSVRYHGEPLQLLAAAPAAVSATVDPPSRTPATDTADRPRSDALALPTPRHD
ncbi:DUF2884 family protein [Xanthomonas maliensis]|uniref:DUF2884 family protein n=1 Tax=Xanthomonas maliensis TaxID=1321368 RepID=UPI0003A7D588|nr:DUF2884 family protein [Xanthomonas maliensis]KAB7771356.1 DUF2884 domain-containing protein [Xanthomonas maliensis]